MPDGPSVTLDGPSELVQAALSCDLPLEQPCAGDGTCGRCRVRFVAGAPEPTSADREQLPGVAIRDGWRLACQVTLDADASLEIPAVTRSPGVKMFGDDAVPIPDRVPVLASRRRDGGRAWALALDIGTTTLAAALVDPETGRVGAADTALNPQAGVGPDVMSRIHYAACGSAAREALTSAVRRAIASLVVGLCRAIEVPPERVAAAAVAGNPTMLHLWRGVDPAGLGQSPYLGRWVEAVTCAARDVGLPTAADGEVYLLPAVRSHVGADAVAAAVAVDLDRATHPELLIDLGTNAEILLGGADGILAASTAAGPAFEGGVVSCGMRAGPGAIDAFHIESDGRFSARVIGGGAAAGICGSGLLDAVAELRRTGVIDAGGRLTFSDQAGPALPFASRERLQADTLGKYVVLSGTATDGDGVLLRATDVRQVQLAVGAVRAGIDILCERAGVGPSQIGRIHVAGAFGQFVRLRSLLRLGMLPEVDPERIRVAGNAAGEGVRLALLDRRVRDRAERLARAITYVDLGGRADYAEIFARHLRFPEPVRRGC